MEYANRGKGALNAVENTIDSAEQNWPVAVIVGEHLFFIFGRPLGPYTMPDILSLSQNDIEAIALDTRSVINRVERAFVELGHNRTEMPSKLGIRPGSGSDSFIHAMPASIPSMEGAGIKWISAYPGNSEFGLPNISGLIILNDPETGVPVAILDCSWITAARTGAATALSAKYLARSDAATIGVLGCGAQGWSNLRSIHELFDLESVKLFNTSEDPAQRLAVKAADELGLSVEIVKDPKDAVTDLDIVVTAGPILKTPHATIQQDWLSEGAFASLVDFDSYWSREALSQSDLWFTDDVRQYEHYRDSLGYFQGCPALSGDLSQLVTGAAVGRARDDQRILSVNLGLAIEDVAVALLLLEKAWEQGLGTVVSL